MAAGDYNVAFGAGLIRHPVIMVVEGQTGHMLATAPKTFGGTTR